MASVEDQLITNNLTYADLQRLFPKPGQEYLVEYLRNLLQDIVTVAAAVDNNQPQFGSGSPEGVVTANLNRTYYDTSIPEMWVNETVGANTGWVQIV